MLLSLLLRNSHLQQLVFVGQLLGGLDINHRLAVDAAVTEPSLELLWRIGNLLLHARLDNPLCHHRHGRQEVGNIGSLGRHKP